MTIFKRITEIIKNKPFVMMFELGACDGLDTGRILDVIGAKPYRYYAFEADPRRIQGDGGLRAHVGSFVTIVPKAVAAVDGLVDFHFCCEDYYGSSSLKRPTSILLSEYPQMKFEEGKVEGVRLDTFCRQEHIEHIDFIWSDLQGAERDMIEGGRETLSFTEWLYTEYNDGHAYEGNAGLKDIVSLLLDWELVEDYGGDALFRNKRF